MDSNIIVGLASGFFGAIIGSMTSIMVVVVQERSARRRERSRLAVESAIEDRKGILEIYKNSKATIPPLSMFIHFHSTLLELIDQGKLTPEKFRQMSEEQEKFRKASE